MAVKLTKEGYENLRKELVFLQTTKRQEVIKAIEEARAHGDLKENAEYDAAKEAQGHLEKRIAELDDMLSAASVLDDEQIDASKVYLGAKVTIRDLNKNAEFQWQLLSPAEADFAQGKISAESPVGNALIGKEEGDEVEINIPAGTLKYKILKIER